MAVTNTGNARTHRLVRIGAPGTRRQGTRRRGAPSGTSARDHAAARPWIEIAVAEAGAGTAFSLMPMVLASFLRLVTSPRIFQTPTPIADAVAFIDALLAAPCAQVVQLGAEWPMLRQVCLDKQPGGIDLPDAWLEAAVDFLGEHLVSFDRDFRKLLGRGQFTLLASESP